MVRRSDGRSDGHTGGGRGGGGGEQTGRWIGGRTQIYSVYTCIIYSLSIPLVSLTTSAMPL